MTFAEFPSSLKTGPLSALLVSLDEWFRGIIGDTNSKWSHVQAQGDPPFAAGQWFFAWHPVNAGGRSKQANYVDNIFTIACTMSVKSTVVPHDREKAGLLTGDRQVLDVMNWLIGESAVHGNYNPIITRATQLLGGPAETKQGFSEPLYFQIQTMERRGPDWWKAQGAAHPTFGYSIETRFQGAAYIREKTL